MAPAIVKVQVVVQIPSVVRELSVLQDFYGRRWVTLTSEPVGGILNVAAVTWTCWWLMPWSVS